MPEAMNDVCMSSLCFHVIIFYSNFSDNISLVGMSWKQKFIGLYKNIALKTSLLPGNKSSDSFNFYLQKSITRWEPSFNIPRYYCRTDAFKNSFFPTIINEWDKLDEKIKCGTSFSRFKALLLKMGCPHAKSTYTVHNPVGIRLLTRLCLGLSRLNKNKFKHSLTDCVNPLCSCNIKPQITLLFFSALTQLLKHQKKII